MDLAGWMESLVGFVWFRLDRDGITKIQQISLSVLDGRLRCRRFGDAQLSLQHDIGVSARIQLAGWLICCREAPSREVASIQLNILEPRLGHFELGSGMCLPFSLQSLRGLFL